MIQLKQDKKIFHKVQCYNSQDYLLCQIPDNSKLGLCWAKLTLAFGQLANAEAVYQAQLNLLSQLQLRITFFVGGQGVSGDGLIKWEQIKLSPAQAGARADLVSTKWLWPNMLIMNKLFQNSYHLDLIKQVTKVQHSSFGELELCETYLSFIPPTPPVEIGLSIICLIQSI